MSSRTRSCRNRIRWSSRTMSGSAQRRSFFRGPHRHARRDWRGQCRNRRHTTTICGGRKPGARSSLASGSLLGRPATAGKAVGAKLGCAKHKRRDREASSHLGQFTRCQIGVQIDPGLDLGQRCTSGSRQKGRACWRRDSGHSGSRARSKTCVTVLGAWQLRCWPVFPRARPKSVGPMRRTDQLNRTLPLPTGRRI